MNRVGGLTLLANGFDLFAQKVFLPGLAGRPAHAGADWFVRASGVHTTVLTAN